jgi:hypothetical protein
VSKMSILNDRLRRYRKRIIAAERGLKRHDPRSRRWMMWARVMLRIATKAMRQANIALER